MATGDPLGAEVHAERLEQSAASSMTGSQASSMDSTILHLSRDPLHKVFWSSAIPGIVSSFVEGLSSVGELCFVTSYLSVDGGRSYMLALPLDCLMLRGPVQALGNACAVYVGKALSTSRVKLANQYLATFVFLSLCWAALAMVLVPPLAKPVLEAVITRYDTSSAQRFLIAMAILSPGLSIFSHAVGTILAVENRGFLNLSRSIVLSLLRMLGVMLCCYLNSQVRTPDGVRGSAQLYDVALGWGLAGLAVTVWILLVYLRVPVLGVSYRSSLRLNLKAMLPFRARVFKNLLTTGATYYLRVCPTPLVLAIANITASVNSIDSEDLGVYRVSAAAYLAFNELFSCTSKAMAESFHSIATFNAYLKNYGRVSAALIICFAYSLIFGIVCTLVGVLVAPVVSGLLLTYLKDLDELDRDLYRSNIQTGMVYGSIPAVWMGFFWAATSLLQLEGRVVLLCIIHLVRVVVPIVILAVMALVMENNDDILLAPLISDCIAGVAGILYLGYGASKYKYLDALDQAKKQQQELEAQLRDLQ